MSPPNYSKSKYEETRDCVDEDDETRRINGRINETTTKTKQNNNNNEAEQEQKRSRITRTTKENKNKSAMIMFVNTEWLVERFQINKHASDIKTKGSKKQVSLQIRMRKQSKRDNKNCAITSPGNSKTTVQLSQSKRESQ